MKRSRTACGGARQMRHSSDDGERDRSLSFAPTRRAPGSCSGWASRRRSGASCDGQTHHCRDRGALRLGRSGRAPDVSASLETIGVADDFARKRTLMIGAGSTERRVMVPEPTRLPQRVVGDDIVTVSRRLPSAHGDDSTPRWSLASERRSWTALGVESARLATGLLVTRDDLDLVDAGRRVVRNDRKLDIQLAPPLLQRRRSDVHREAAAAGAAVATMTTGTVQATPFAMVRRSISRVAVADSSRRASSLCIVIPPAEAAGRRCLPHYGRN